MATEKLLKLGLIHSSFRNNGPIWMKFGAYLTGIDLKLPVENDRYWSTDVTMVTERSFKLSLICSNCGTIGPIWMKFGKYLTDIDPRLPIKNGRYS